MQLRVPECLIKAALGLAAEVEVRVKLKLELQKEDPLGAQAPS